MTALPSLVDYREPLVVLPEETQNFSVSCVPTGSGTFGPSTQIQIDLQNRGFLDPASLLIRYKITYTKAAAGNVQIVGTPAYTPFVRLDTIINSQNVESISNYNTVANMICNLQMSVADKYGQMSALGYESANPVVMEGLDGGLVAVPAALTVDRFYSAPLHCLLSGSEKLIPLFLLNGIRLQFTTDTLANVQTGVAANALLTGYTISNFEVCYNCIDMGGSVEREIIAMNPKLRIKTQSYATGNQTVGNAITGTQSLVYNLRYASCKSAFVVCGGTDVARSANRLMDAYDITSGNGDYQLTVNSVSYPQKALSTVNNRSGILQELRRAMNSIFAKNNSMSINRVEFAIQSDNAGPTTIDAPAKFFVGFNLQKLTVPMKAFFTGISTQNAPIVLTINIGNAGGTGQAHNVMLVLNYDAIMEIDTSTKQVLVIS